MYILQTINTLVHFDKYIIFLTNEFGSLVYLIIALTILLETGLVITPFLPGDSLLFVAGALAGAGNLNLIVLLTSLTAAAIIGDSINYWIGKYFGDRIFSKSKLFKREYLKKTEEFYQLHGGKTIIMARFMPILRTFAPFVAGIGKMDYSRFLSFNVIGGVLWVFFFVIGG